MNSYYHSVLNINLHTAVRLFPTLLPSGISWSQPFKTDHLSGQLLLFKSNLLLFSLYYAEACNESAGSISAAVRLGNLAPFKEMSQRWQAVGIIVFNLTGSRFEPQTSNSRDERVTAWPTGRSCNFPGTRNKSSCSKHSCQNWAHSLYVCCQS